MTKIVKIDNFAPATTGQNRHPDFDDFRQKRRRLVAFFGDFRKKSPKMADGHFWRFSPKKAPLW